MEAKQDILSDFDEQVKTAEKSVNEAQEVKEDEPKKVVEAHEEVAPEVEDASVEPEVEKSAKEDEKVEDEKDAKDSKDSKDEAEKSEDVKDSEDKEDDKEVEKSEPEDKPNAIEDPEQAKKSEEEDKEAEPEKEEAEKSEPEDKEEEEKPEPEDEEEKPEQEDEEEEEEVKKGLTEDAENGQTFEAFKSILTSSMGNISKSFEVSQKQNTQTNERLDALSKSVSDLTALVSNYFSTEKNLSEDAVVTTPEAEPVEDEKDVYVAEKSVAAGSVIEEEPKEEELSKSVDMKDLYNQARSLRTAYTNKYQAQAQAGILTRAEYLEKSTSVDDVTYGRNLDAEKLNKFIDYASK